MIFLFERKFKMINSFMIFRNSEFAEFKLYIQVPFKLGSAINEIFKQLKTAL